MKTELFTNTENKTALLVTTKKTSWPPEPFFQDGTKLNVSHIGENLDGYVYALTKEDRHYELVIIQQGDRVDPLMVPRSLRMFSVEQDYAKYEGRATFVEYLMQHHDAHDPEEDDIVVPMIYEV